MHPEIPNHDIDVLSEYREDNIMISRFAEYLSVHPNLMSAHRHSFYHLVFFTKGAGQHTIDFNHFTVEPFQIYFMIPGQVHSWNFSGPVDGYVVNFSTLFFESFLLKPAFLDSFSFFNGIAEESVINVSNEVVDTLISLFENLLKQVRSYAILKEEMLKVILLQIFITIEQTEFKTKDNITRQNSNTLIREFQKLIEKKFVTARLPGEYAEFLHITPNHLNALSKEHLGKQAGEVIRDRIILEAKRLLVSLDLTVSEIAYQLNFNDNSYFTKFFRKYAGITPEAFRKKSMSEQNEVFN